MDKRQNPSPPTLEELFQDLSPTPMQDAEVSEAVRNFMGFITLLVDCHADQQKEKRNENHRSRN